MLLFSEQEFAAGGHGNLDADSIVMVTSRQATSSHVCVIITKSASPQTGSASMAFELK
jgi:hypothetical protein